MRSRSYLCLAAVVLLLSCESSRLDKVRPENLSVTVHVEQDLDGHAVISIVTRNLSGRCILISESHGFSAAWFALQIEDEEGRSIGYPRDLPEITLLDLPKYERLEPGEVRSFAIDLMDWGPRFEGVPFGGMPQDLTFGLNPGMYRLQVVYREVAVHDALRRRECSLISGVVHSEWITFSI